MRPNSDEINTFGDRKSLFLRLLACTSLIFITSIIGGICLPIQITDGNDSTIAKYLDAFGKGRYVPNETARRLMESNSIKSSIRNAEMKQLPDLERIYEIENMEKERSSEIAWLISFPNSGTSFTTALVRNTTKTNTATNYNLKFGVDRPISDSDSDGPFYTPIQNRPLPHSGYILTKTHCGGYRTDVLDVISPLTFLDKCRETNKKKGHRNYVKTHYDVKKVKKIVHLLRNPLDNAVSRFHLEYRDKVREGDTKWVESHPKNSEGFRNWCSTYDKHLVKARIHTVTNEVLSSNVMCHIEFYNYAQWHNNAFRVINALKLPSLKIHYEDYHSNFDSTLHNLLEFLDLPKLAQANYFELKSYDDYYTPEEKDDIMKFMKNYSSPETWDQLKERYF